MKTTLISTLILMSMLNAYSQFCLEYPEIEGPQCGFCVPEGWVIEASSPDVFPPDSYSCMPGESPSGGNAIHLFSNGSNDIEAISTEFEIDDFVPGSEYYFGMYYVTCGPHDVEILITINGEEYSVGSAQEWQYLELCIEPESAAVSIEVTVADYDSGMITNTLIDSGVCDESFCCTLDAEIAEEYIELCPGDDPYLVDLDIWGETGNVDVEWTSDPSNGVNYLDDVNAIQPFLEIPYDENFGGGTFYYTVEIEDEDCSIIREFELFIHPSEVPEFEIFLCELYDEYEMPLVSDDGYSGTWEGNFYFDELGGMVEEYTFTLDPGQDNCIQEWTYEYLIHFAEPVSFDFETVYCVNDDNTYRLPEESEERIEGDWDEEKFTPDELGEGIHVFTFYIDQENFCAADFEFEIEIVGEQELTFDIPINFCSQQDSIFLPDTSLQGIAGMWEMPFIDLNVPVEDQSIQFTSADDTDCYSDFTLNFSVQEEIENSFNVIDSLCRSVDSYIFDPMSQEGYQGIWVPEAIDPDTVFASSIQIVWTPLDSLNSCLKSSELTVYLKDYESPDFDIPLSICQGSGEFELPLLDQAGMAGSWNVSNFDPDTLMVDSMDLVFTPDEECAQNFMWTLFISDETLDDSEFQFDTELCADSEEILLPTSSINGINGTWSVSSLDPSVIEDSLVVTFYPENDVNTCYDTLNYTFFVADLIEAEFDVPELLCFNSEIFEFPEISLNGIEGYWETSSFNSNEYDGSGSFVNVFVPLDQSCYEGIAVEIEVFDFSEFSYTLEDLNSCNEDNGSILINSSYALELSMDGGSSWQKTDTIMNLAEGQYELIVMNIQNSCMDTIDFELSAPGGVWIDDIQIEPIKDCSMQGASIACMASGENMEYSLNSPDQWSTDNVFEGLSPGKYWIYVHDANTVDCIDSLEFTIEDFPLTFISDIMYSDVSDCNAEDGRIEIIAEGQNLEYSIDEGLSWQSSNVFNNLSFGVYEIHVRSADANDCLDTYQQILNSPEVPQIQMLDVVDQSSCLEDNASIVVSASGIDLEYSIDGGSSWQDSNIFEGLAGGSYVVSIREKTASDCFSSTQVEINTPMTIEIIQSELIQPSQCYDSDASVFIEVNDPEAEFSIDGGQSWTLNNSFENIEEGNYEILIQNPQFPDCASNFTFEVDYPPCPCNLLTVDLSSEPVDCLDPISGSVFIESIYGNMIDGDLELVWEDGSNDWQIDGLTEGWFSYTINYDKNCEQRDSVYIDSFDPISFDLLSYDQDCQNLGTIEVTNFMGGVGEPSYSIDGINFQENTVFTGLSAQEYQVFIEDLFNCFGEESATINDNSDLQLDIPGVQAIAKGESTFLNPLINEMSIDSFEWYPLDGIINPGNLVAQVSPNETTSYTLTIYFGDCIEIRSVTVEVLQDPVLYIANMFSPNGDGDNDYFIVQSNPDLDLLINSLRVFDRWGNLVYEANSFKTNSNDWAWDGRKNDRDLIPGVYVYTVEFDFRGESFLESGTVTLVR